jgi:fatty acid desaturase
MRPVSTPEGWQVGELGPDDVRRPFPPPSRHELRVSRPVWPRIARRLPNLLLWLAILLLAVPLVAVPAGWRSVRHDALLWCAGAGVAYLLALVVH